jgi:hypothetical protein
VQKKESNAGTGPWFVFLGLGAMMTECVVPKLQGFKILLAFETPTPHALLEIS